MGTNGIFGLPEVIDFEPKTKTRVVCPTLQSWKVGKIDILFY